MRNNTHESVMITVTETPEVQQENLTIHYYSYNIQQLQ